MVRKLSSTIFDRCFHLLFVLHPSEGM